MSISALPGRVQAWLGPLGNMLLAGLAALLLADLVALRQPAPTDSPDLAPLPIESPLPLAASALWQGQGRPGLSETRLPLTLVGSFRAEPASRSLVVLATPDGQVVARPGDPVMPSVRLVSIGAQGLILDNAGRRERLRIAADDNAKITGIRRLNAP